MPIDVKMPGQELEKAAGEVATHAGKALIDTLFTYCRSFLAPDIARREALSRQIAARIDQETDIEKQDREIAVRRQRQLDEQRHQAQLHVQGRVLERAVARFMSEMQYEQEVIETIMIGSVAKAESFGDSAQPREVEGDWIRAFFKYAKDVGNETIRDIFSSILANASIAERPLVPLRALDMIRFMDKETVGEFLSIARPMALYGFVTEAFAITLSGRGKVKRTTLEALEEIGLVKRFYVYMTRIQIGEIALDISLDVGSTYRFDVYKFTQAGTALIDILNEDIRTIHLAYGSPKSTKPFWQAQERLGVSTEELASFLRHIISEVSDARNVAVEITGRFDDLSFRRIAAVEKRDNYDPFRLDLSDADLSRYDTKVADFARVFESVFRDYDENTLPSMKRGDDINIKS